MISETLDRNAGGQRLDRWLRKRFPEASLSWLFAVVRKRKVRVNGKVAKAPQMLCEGDVVEIYENLPTAKEEIAYNAPKAGNAGIAHNTPDARKENIAHKAPVKLPLRIFAQWDDVLVLDKPAGVPSQPGSGTRPGESLVEILWANVEDGWGFKPQLAHRLDQETSGLVLAAKSAPALRELARIIRERGVRKEYLALVLGRPAKPSGTIELPLERHDSAKGAKMTVGQGVDATTRYREEKAFAGCTLLRIRIETGRMHQIRAHMSHIGCPLLGDGRYGDFEQNRKARKELGLKRLFLHAALLELEWEGEKRLLECPLPEELQKVIATLEAAAIGR